MISTTNNSKTGSAKKMMATMMIIASLHPAIIQGVAAYCDAIYCSGRSESSCRSAFGCSTYEECTTYTGQYGMSNTITSTCGQRCTTSNSCFRDFKTKDTCNAQDNCKWQLDDDDGGVYEEPASGSNFGTCSSIRLSNACDGTDMGSIGGLYKPVAGTSCGGSPMFGTDDGEWEMYYSSSSEKWYVGKFCGDCSCLDPYITSFSDANPGSVSCWDGGSGSSKSYDYDDVSVTCNGGSSSSSGSSNYGSSSSSSSYNDSSYYSGANLITALGGSMITIFSAILILVA